MDLAAAHSLALPPFAFERTPGAASRPARGLYRRRAPETTALHEVVRGHLDTLLEEARRRSDEGHGYPAFVQREFARYLDCGQLPRGFARLRCPDCGFERLVAFSCKGRICPSCWARRAGDTAAHLVDRVLPRARYRQWVLTFPWQVRFLLAVDGKFLSEVLGVFLKTLFAWMRLRGRRAGIRMGEAGAVTFVQRFGGILNLNPHFHCAVPDGLFVEPADGDGTGPVEFHPLPPPTEAEFQAFARRVATRLGKLARRRLEEAENDPRWKSPRRAAYLSSAWDALRAPGRAGGHDDPDAKPLCARIDGFSLHAARTVAPSDRTGLERLCRYGLRAPFSQERLSVDPDGQVRCRLLRPWPTPEGRLDLVLEPVAFLRRLAALIPAPYLNLVRYHGVFANRHGFRKRLPAPVPGAGSVVPAPAPPHPLPGPSAAARRPDTSAERPRRLPWAALLRRVLDVDALTCPRCNVPMVVLAFLTDPAVVRRILVHLQLPADVPPLGALREAPEPPAPDGCDPCVDPPSPDEFPDSAPVAAGTPRAPP